MNLDELAAAIEDVADTIGKHRVELAKSESATRHALIDPLLQKLGWDLSDLNQCKTEYGTGQKRDYALFSPNDTEIPRVIIEAKSLGTNFTEKIKNQLTNYCNNLGTDFGILTDGNRWIFYDIYKKAPLDEKTIQEINIDEPEGNNIMKFLWLWQGNFSDDNSPDIPILPPTKKTTPTESRALTEILSSDYTPQFPISICFPNEPQMEVKSWVEFSLNVFSTLISQGKFDRETMPLDINGAFINNEPKSKGGTSMHSIKSSKGYYFEGGKNKKNHKKFVSALLNHFDIDANKVRFIDRND